MGMRLLQKSEIDRKKAVEQKTLMDEGLKIAKRVDILRETVAREEVALERFRASSVETINAEIVPLEKKKNDIKKEVSDLEDTRRELMKPLDAEWARVRELDRKNASKLVFLEEWDDVLTDVEKKTQEFRIEAEQHLRAAQTREKLAQEAIDDAARAHESAKAALGSAHVVETKALELKKKTEKLLTHREGVVAEREKNAMLKETDLVAREQSLSEGWKLLKDREALLERTLKRTQ